MWTDRGCCTQDMAAVRMRITLRMEECGGTCLNTAEIQHTYIEVRCTCVAPLLAAWLVTPLLPAITVKIDWCVEIASSALFMTFTGRIGCCPVAVCDICKMPSIHAMNSSRPRERAARMYWEISRTLQHRQDVLRQ